MDDKDALMSSSEQYIKKSNRILLLVGVGAFILFLFALVSSMGVFDTPAVVDATPIADSSIYFPDRTSIDIELNRSADPLRITTKEKEVLALKPSPESVLIDGIVIGGVAESILTLTAEGGPIRIVSMELAEKQQDGFKIEGTCQKDTALKEGTSCNAKIIWQPSSIRRIQNNLNIVWKLDDITVYPPPKEKKLIVTIVGQSTDSKDCIICEDKTRQTEEKETENTGLCDEATGMCLSSAGEIIRLIQPERIAISLDGSLLGQVLEKTKEVTNDMGDVVGRVLNDGTVVSKDLKVLGATLGVLPVMNHNGTIIGRLTTDGTVVDGENKIVGFPMADGSVVMNEEIIGSVMPWSVILNGFSKAVGVTQKDGSVINAQKEVIGQVLPSGWVINKNGTLIGGVVPKGIAIGYGCQSLGIVRENGKILNAFEQPIGFVTPEGNVMNLGTEPIGRVVRDGLIINAKGEILAFVNSEGKAVTKDADILGCLNPDGTVSHGEDIVGGVVPKGRVIGFSKDILGVTLPDASIVRSNYEKIATATYFGEVLDEKSQIIGQVIPRGTAVGNSCELLGIIDLNGSVLENGQKLIGTISPSGTIIDANYNFLGRVTPIGTVSSISGEAVGSVRFDGKVLDKTGKVTSCVLPNGVAITEKGEVLGRVAQDGVILDETGTPLGWIIVGEKVYDTTGREIGKIVDRQVISPKGYIVGYLPESGLVVSQEGRVLGRFNKEVGYVTDMEGRRFGRLLPGNVVVGLDTNEVVGGMIPYGRSVISLDGSSVGLVLRNGKVIPATGPVKPIKNADGTLTEVEETIGVIRADGTVVNKNEDFIGVVASSGLIADWNGTITGYVAENGVAWNFSNKKIGLSLPGKTVKSDGNVIVGKVMDKMKLPVNGKGDFIGFISVDGTVFEKNQPVGKVTPYGSVWDKKGFVASAVDFGTVVNEKKEIAGWLGFNGNVNTTASKVLGKMMPEGIVVDDKGQQVAHLNQVGEVITELSGAFLGVVGIKGKLMGRNAEVIGGFPFGAELTDVKDIWIGRLMPAGVVIDLKGDYLGSLRFNAEPIRDDGRVIGMVSTDNRVFGSSTDVVGQYVPYGSMALDSKGRVIGLMDFRGEIRSFEGKSVGKIIGNQIVSSSGVIVGELKKGSFALSTTGKLLGNLIPPAIVEYKKDDALVKDTLISGNMLLDEKGMLLGGKITQGITLGLDLKILGIQSPDGQIFSSSGKVAQAVPNGIIYDSDGLGRIVGQTIPMNVIIDRSGRIVGKTSVSSVVNDFAGTRVGTLMPFGSVLSADNKLFGTVMPSGTIVDDDGKIIGVTSSNGTIFSSENKVVARVLQGGTAVSVESGRTDVYTLMPDIGEVLKEGVVVDLKGEFLGRTSPDGDVINPAGEVLGHVLDSGTVLGKDGLLIGTVLPRRSVIDVQANVIGLVTGEATVQNLRGENNGRLATNGVVKKGMVLLNLGRIVPDKVAVNACSIAGQVRPDGRIVNGKGELVGFINIDGSATSLKGNVFGGIVLDGTVVSKGGTVVGRTLYDGHVIDTKGVTIGCVSFDGVVRDFDGNEIGGVAKRGVVIDKDGKILGRVKRNGDYFSPDGQKLGKVVANGDVLDVDEEKVGIAVDIRREQLLFDDNGVINGFLTLNGGVYDTSGKHLYSVDETSQVYDPAGNHIGSISENGAFLDRKGRQIGQVGKYGVTEAPILMYDDQGNVTFIVNLRDKIVTNAAGEIISEITEEGDMVVRGEDGESIEFRLSEDDKLETVSKKEGEEEKVVGSTQLGDDNKKKEAVRSMLIPSLPTSVPADILTRNIKIGSDEYQVLPDNTIVEPGTNTIIGFMRDNVAYSTSDVPLGQEVERKKVQQEVIRFSPEQLQQRQRILYQRRAAMGKGLVGSSGLSKITPNKRLLARSKDKITSNFGDDQTSVSSWPIKMDRMIMKGKAIPAVLQTSIDSRYAETPVTAIVERHIYAETGRVIIIPAGSRLVGKADSGAGTNRVAKINISWERLVRPDGAYFKLGGSKSGDAQGRGGVAGYLDTNFLSKYGKPILQSALTSVLTYLISVDEAVSQSTNDSGGESVVSSDKAEAAQDARENFVNSMGDIFQQMIEDSTNVPPVVFIPSGTRLTVYAENDLWLRSETDDMEEIDNTFGEESNVVSRPENGGYVERPTFQQDDANFADEDEVVYSGNGTHPTEAENTNTNTNVNSSGGNYPAGTSASSGSNLLTLEQLYQSDSGVNSFPSNVEKDNLSAPLEKQDNKSGRGNLF